MRCSADQDISIVGGNYADYGMRFRNRACGIFGAIIQQRPTNYATSKRGQCHHGSAIELCI
jgi:hypothetical protein